MRGGGGGGGGGEEVGEGRARGQGGLLENLSNLGVSMPGCLPGMFVSRQVGLAGMGPLADASPPSLG